MNQSTAKLSSKALDNFYGGKRVSLFIKKRDKPKWLILWYIYMYGFYTTSKTVEETDYADD